MDVCVRGMSCQSCEVKIENAWKKIPGVEHVHVSAANGRARLRIAGEHPSHDTLHAAIADHGYAVVDAAMPLEKPKRPSVLAILGFFGLALFVGLVLSRLGLLSGGAIGAESTGFVSVFLLGLFAASSSCIAVSGGLMLSTITQWNARLPQAKPWTRMVPVGLFIAGRLASYTLFGGLIGALGALLSPPPAVTAGILIVAAVYMFLMGLDMLGIMPRFIKKLLPRMPKRLAHTVFDAEGRTHPAMPFLLGAGTFFLPCGFTQSLQVYALTTGSFAAGGLTLLAFALGTAPALLALGYASSTLKGAWGRFFFRFAGAAVVLLGIWNIQNGLAVGGWSLPTIRLVPRTVAQAPVQNGEQVVNIRVGDTGYAPSQFTLRAGIPATLRLQGKISGCTSSFIIPKFGISKNLNPKSVTEIRFTPTQTGQFGFSCGMGMIRGSFSVVAS